MPQRNDAERRAELSKLVEQRRRELESRPDISQTMRRLSESSSRNTASKPSRRLSTRVLILSAVAIAALMTCILGTVVVIWANHVVQSGLSDPTNTVQEFYGALHQTNYVQAYSYFSESAKAQLSQSSFVDLYSSYDRVGGIVQNFPIQSTAIHGNTAVVVALVTRRGDDDSGQLQTLHLVSSSGTWYIDSIVIGATVPLPASTATS